MTHGLKLFRTPKSKMERGRDIRLGLLLKKTDMPSEQERELFFSQFGRQHCFLLESWLKRFIVISPSGTEKLPLDSLPIDYLYAPHSWDQRLTDDQIRNALLSLRHLKNDFLIVSASLSEFPLIEVSSLRNQTIVSTELGLDFLESKNTKEATGKILRLLPYDHPVTELNVEREFQNQSVKWSPADSWKGINGARPVVAPPMPSAELITSFIPRFNKTKPLVFVWPIFMVVGGAERNAIEIMRQLKDRYHFVVITMERPYKNQGSLHHQLRDITEAVYDLAELAPFDNYLDILRDLKQTYQPDAIWTCNGSPWFCDSAKSLRELFKDVPIIDQQVYDTNRGWILRYREPGIQSFDRFIAINKKIQETFIERFEMDPDRIDLIYHGVDSDRFDPSSYPASERAKRFRQFDLDEQRRLFIFAGRLTGQKRPMDFLNLALRRQRAGDNAFFLMVGDGHLSSEADDFVRSHGLTNVRRIPFVENMAELFSIASGLVMTSEFEGMPIVILEALCMGIPVLATDVGDIKLILDQYQAGFVIPEVGNEDLIEKSYEAWNAELDVYRSNAQTNVETVRNRFSGETVAHQYATSWDLARKQFKLGAHAKVNVRSDLVSIIIPSYNHAPYIERAIHSALAQSYDRIEVIVVDDGSTDGSVNYIKTIKDPRYSFYCQENQGAHVAINRGLGLASGEFIAILNSDDVFYPDRIQNLLGEFRQDPETELLSTWIEVIDESEKQLGIKHGWHDLEPWPIEHPELSFKQTDDFLLNLLMGNFVATTSNIMMRRTLYSKIGGMRRLRFTHDWDFLLRAAAVAKCKLIPQPLIKYRVHESNTISSNRAWMLFEICWVLAANLHRSEASRIFSNADPEKLAEDLVKLYESINLQGNDKVFWLLRAFIQSQRSAGIENSEELLLEDGLREKLIGYITV